MGWRSKNKAQDKIVEGVKSADIDNKVEIFQEAVKVAYEHGNAEKLLRDVVRNVAPNVKQAAATEAVSSDKEAASYILSQVAKQAPLEDKKETVKEAVDNTDNQRAAREVIFAAMSAAPEASKDAVAKVVKTAESEDQQELLTQAIDAAPASTAEAAVRDAGLSPTPTTIDRIWVTIVTTFSWVLGGATAGVLAIVVLDIFYPVELAHVQIMLTMFTTVAGILAGFITGQAVGTAQERQGQRLAKTPVAERLEISRNAVRKRMQRGPQHQRTPPLLWPLLALFTQVIHDPCRATPKP